MTTPKFTIFDTKESYLAFRRAWAAAVASKEARHSLEPPTEYTSDGKPIKVSGRHRYHGWVTASHHIFFNIIRGRDKFRGFDLDDKHTINRTKKLEELGRLLTYARDYNKPDYATSYKSSFVNSFLRPFGGTLTVEQLVKLQLE